MNKSYILLCLLLAPLVGATTVYKTVDERGRVSFSDQPPAQVTQLVEVLQYATSTRAPSALDIARIEAMREVTDRMAADRRERENRRAQARRQASAYAEPAYYDASYPDNSGSFYYEKSYYGSGYPVYGKPWLRPPNGLRPPAHRPPSVRPPIARPPLGQATHRPRPGIANPPRAYPASLVRRHYTGTAREVFYSR